MVGVTSAGKVGGRITQARDIGGYGCSTVVLVCITCPAITVVTVILWALDRVRGRALGLGLHRSGYL